MTARDHRGEHAERLCSVRSRYPGAPAVSGLFPYCPVVPPAGIFRGGNYLVPVGYRGCRELTLGGFLRKKAVTARVSCS